jgi:hypothetical protein
MSKSIVEKKVLKELKRTTAKWTSIEERKHLFSLNLAVKGEEFYTCKYKVCGIICFSPVCVV